MKYVSFKGVSIFRFYLRGDLEQKVIYSTDGDILEVYDILRELILNIEV